MSHKITHAIISVSDKEGILEFAQGLCNAGIIIISTGGTAALLKKHAIDVIEVPDFTGFPEILDGRVKTLHPKLYAGILARGEKDADLLQQLNIPQIGLVVVNLYPFEQVTAKADCTLEVAIENIDIGGPTLLRAAAKNFYHTTVVTASDDYAAVLQAVRNQNATSIEFRYALAKKVFAHVAKYDASISNYFSARQLSGEKQLFPDTFSCQFDKKLDLRYGENPHQAAAFYTDNQVVSGTISQATQKWGKPLSYNNIADADCALACVKQFNAVACVIVKHANPCAVSIANNQLEAYEKAYAADSSSAFGGIIAFNTPLETKTLEKILANQFVEVIVAPEVCEQSLKIAAQKPNIRILAVGDLRPITQKTWEMKSVEHGILLQETDNLPTATNIQVVTQRQPTQAELQDLRFAWQVARFVKSNAIVYAKNQSTLGIGPGQMSRVFSTKIAALKAQQATLSLERASMASDAFFPFRDSIDEAASMGISAIIQPGGSIRDADIIEAANEHQLTMIFTGLRHFRH